MVLAAYGVMGIGLVDNLLRPLLVGKDTKLPDYIVLISTLGGMSLFGLTGFVIGPVIAALFIACWDMFYSQPCPCAGCRYAASFGLNAPPDLHVICRYATHPLCPFFPRPAPAARTALLTGCLEQVSSLGLPPKVLAKQKEDKAIGSACRYAMPQH